MAKKSKHPIDMSTLFSSTSGTLAQIAKKTNSLNKLKDIVRQSCPDLPAQVWQIANFHQNTLVIEVNSAIWGQRLQFERMKICQQLSIITDGQFTHIEIKVAPYRNKSTQSMETQPIPAKSQSIPSATAEQLADIAKDAPEGLKQSLLRLAKLAQNKRP
ncbi:DUF721 domain-containing protein [Thalassotalea ganghwensis]